jgi:hypothetical protein
LTAFIGKQRGVGVVETADKVGAMPFACYHNEWSTSAVGEFTDASFGFVALDLDASGDNVTDSEYDFSPAFVDAFALNGAAFVIEDEKEAATGLSGAVGSREEALQG